jgi:hypothetical protein
MYIMQLKVLQNFFNYKLLMQMQLILLFGIIQNQRQVFLATGTAFDNETTYIAYCFAEKQGYSKFGSYTGNGDADGTFVYTGFKPAFLLIKQSGAVGKLVND